MTHTFVIQRRADAWYWIDGTQWTDNPHVAKHFRWRTEALIAAVKECPIALGEWTTVEIPVFEAVAEGSSPLRRVK